MANPTPIIVGDIWKNNTEGQPDIVISEVNSVLNIISYRKLRDNTITSKGMLYTRELRTMYTFKQRGPHVGDVWQYKRDRIFIVSIDFLARLQYKLQGMSEKKAASFFDVMNNGSLELENVTEAEFNSGNAILPVIKGDIWKSKTSDVKIVITKYYNNMGGIHYRSISDNYMLSSEPVTTTKLNLLALFEFHKRGPHIGDVWMSPSGVSLLITGVDFNLNLPIRYRSKNDARIKGSQFDMIKNGTLVRENVTEAEFISGPKKIKYKALMMEAISKNDTKKVVEISRKLSNDEFINGVFIHYAVSLFRINLVKALLEESSKRNILVSVLREEKDEKTPLLVCVTKIPKSNKNKQYQLEIFKLLLPHSYVNGWVKQSFKDAEEVDSGDEYDAEEYGGEEGMYYVDRGDTSEVGKRYWKAHGYEFDEDQDTWIPSQLKNTAFALLVEHLTVDIPQNRPHILKLIEILLDVKNINVNLPLKNPPIMSLIWKLKSHLVNSNLKGLALELAKRPDINLDVHDIYGDHIAVELANIFDTDFMKDFLTVAGKKLNVHGINPSGTSAFMTKSAPKLVAFINHSRFEARKLSVVGLRNIVIKRELGIGYTKLDEIIKAVKQETIYLVCQDILISTFDISNLKFLVERYKLDINYNKVPVVPGVLGTLMHVAVYYGEYGKMKDIEDMKDYDINAVDSNGFTALLNLLVNRTTPELIETAIRWINNPKLNVNQGGYLIGTIVGNKIQLIPEFLKRKIDLEIKDAAGKTSLFYSDLKTTELLVKAGANINAEDNNGASVLQLALEKRKIEKAIYLIRKGAKLESTEKGKLIIWAYNNKWSLKPFIEALGPNYMPKFPDDQMRYTLIMMEYTMGYLVKGYIKTDGFNPNKINFKDQNLLAYIIDTMTETSIDFEIIRLLIEKGSDKQKALELATKKGYTSVIDVLISPRRHRMREIRKDRDDLYNKCNKFEERRKDLADEIKKIRDQTDQQFLDDIGKKGMSKCNNELDTLMMEPWKASDYSNTIFLRLTKNGKEHNWCFANQFIKGEYPDPALVAMYPGQIPNVKEPDQEVKINDSLDDEVMADWVYVYNAGSNGEIQLENFREFKLRNTTHKRGDPYAREDSSGEGTAHGKGGGPGKDRYIMWRLSHMGQSLTFYIKWDTLLRKVIKYKKNKIVFEAPTNWSLPIAIFATYEKNVAVGNAQGNFARSRTHGQVFEDIYEVEKITNFKNYDDINRVRDCIGIGCPRLKI